MKILIVSYIFPPDAGGAGSLMYNLLKFFPKKDQLKVLKADDYHSIYCGVYDKSFTLNCDVTTLPSPKYPFGSLIFILNVILKGVELNKKEGIECILAVHPNVFNLLGAFFLNRIICKPLVLYFHDLLSETCRNPIQRAFWALVEKIIIQASSLILVTNEKFRDYYATKGIKAHVFSHCIEINTLRPCAEKIENACVKKVKVVFTGSIYEANEDSIKAFLNAIKALGNNYVEVIFATQAKKAYLKNINVGFLPKEECRKLQRSADILFLPLAFKSPYPQEIKVAFPYKTLEYLEAAKPILAMAPKGSFIEEFVNRNKVGIVVTDPSMDKIIAAIKILLDPWKRREFSKNASKVIKNFDARLRAQQLYSLLKTVTMQKKLKN